MKQILVAAAAILNPQGQLLIAKRPDDKHQGGLWEFPGGKVEADESVEAALKRELLEEIGIGILKCEPLVRIEHDYSDKSVVLDVWVVSSFSGEASGLEGQPIEWIDPVDMDSYQFPEANLPIIAALKTRLGL
jgi:8-oxo-dGTP diphosphatase